MLQSLKAFFANPSSRDQNGGFWPFSGPSQHRKSLEIKAFCGFAFSMKNEYYFFK
jgi:hypothetical protein